MEQSTQAEVKRLTSEVIKLHRNIKDIQSKAEHFCSVNETKYFQLWKFNNDSAQKLLDKVIIGKNYVLLFKFKICKFSR